MRFWGIFLALLGATSVYASDFVDATLTDGAEVLSAMQRSVKEKNFELYLVQGATGQLEPMQFSHGVLEGHEYSRTLYLNNAATGFYTKDDRIVYFNNGEEKLAVGDGRFPNIFTRLFSVGTERIISSYEPVVLGEVRAAGRASIGLKLMPRWNDRYAYVIAIDKNTMLPLSVQTINQAKGLISSFAGVHLVLGEQPSPEISAIAQIADSTKIEDDSMISKVTLDWSLNYIPQGFAKIFSAHYALGNYGSEIDHVMYSDGLTDFSVYLLKTLDSMEYPFVKQGSINLYRHRLSDYEIIVVGDLPFDTEKKIATSYVRQ